MEPVDLLTYVLGHLSKALKLKLYTKYCGLSFGAKANTSSSLHDSKNIIWDKEQPQASTAELLKSELTKE